MSSARERCDVELQASARALRVVRHRTHPGIKEMLMIHTGNEVTQKVTGLVEKESCSTTPSTNKDPTTRLFLFSVSRDRVDAT